MTDRQTQLLSAIINEYIKTAEPIGSVEIVKKYNLKCSPATIRNEMSKLLEQGFLEMLHTSSGRVPTPVAYRFFLNELLEEEELPVLQEVAMKQRLWPSRFEFEKLLRNAAMALADTVHELSIVLTGDNYITYAGTVNILDHKEFWDIDVAKTTLHLLDRPEVLNEIFHKVPYGDDTKSIIGDEFGIENLKTCGLVFSQFSAGNKSGYVGVLGPARMRYENIIPAIRYTKSLIEDLGESW